jgi:3-hydroxypropanoate dehydrogenase
MMMNRLDEAGLAMLFREARTHNAWQPRPVAEEILRELYDLLRWGPTAANGCPARFVFVTTPAGKARLKPCLHPGNVEKTMAAPVTVIIAQDLRFYEKLDRLFPHTNARVWYEGKTEAIRETAFRNATLQGGYLILAARALGLDCGPMSGFDRARLDAEFFPEGTVQSNFLCNLGYGDPAGLFPQSPRLAFEEACRMA